ncbi:MAG: DUF3445 domain-containing protein [Rhodobacteraceae bacterium]|nr:MAG: DUF3445 domain-containing protein [Paracoccaceae bacterium]
MTTTGAPYAPFMDPRTAHPPGVSPLDPAAWLVVDPDYAPQMAQRDRLIADAAEIVTSATEDAGPALAEFRAVLLDHLARDGRWRVGRAAVLRPDDAETPLSLDALRLAGRLCQEDFCLLAPGADPADEHRLIAGVLCFPSRWMLSEKLGRPLTPIHRPVPGYAENLSARVNRLFAALRPDRPLMRVNWLVWPTDMLHMPQSETAKTPVPAVPGRFWLRTERQTLRRLPETGVVVFGIKTTVTPIEDLTPAQRAGLRAALAEKAEAEVGYSSGRDVHEAILAALA